MEKILIVRLSAMGDVVHGLPLAAALRLQFPECELDWVIEERWQELLCASGAEKTGARNVQKPLVDDIFLVNTKRWRKNLLAPETRADIRRLRSSLRAKSYSMVIDVQGAIRSAVIARMSGAPRIIGFEKPRELQARYLYTEKQRALGTHVVDQNVSLVKQAMPSRECVMLPRDPAAEIGCDQRLQSLNIGKFAILNPGAGWAAKEWPAENYGAIAKELFKDQIASIVNYGPGEETLAKRVEQASEGAAKSVACSIGGLIAMLRRASLFIGGDTGPMHLANAIGVPVVAIFGPTDPARNGPYYQPSVVLRHETSLTDYSHKRRDHEGMQNMTPEQVLQAARKLLFG